MTLRASLMALSLIPVPVDCAELERRCVVAGNRCSARMEQAPRACAYARCCHEERECWARWAKVCP